MTLAFPAAAVRAAEEPLLAAGVPLMDRAAFALAGVVAGELRRRRGLVAGGRVALLVGSGNNGGDALVAGARLRARGVAVEAVVVGGHVHAEGLAALVAAGGTVTDLSGGAGVPGGLAARLAGADALVDGIVGTGSHGALRGLAADVVGAVRDALADPPAARRATVVAVDVPSGIGVDDGTVPGVVLPADVTVTFAAAKPGLLLPPAATLAGRVDVIDIGLTLDPADAVVRRLDGDEVAGLWPAPSGTDQKYSRGVVGVVAGTTQFPGAAVLASSGAVRAGAGMVRYVGPRAVADAVLAARPEVVPAPGRVQSWALGPGLPGRGPDDDASLPDDVAAQHREVRDVLAADGDDRVPVVADAGATTLLPDRVPPTVVLTPHAGELAALLRARGEDVDRAEVEAAPLAHARRAHELTGATVLLKGAVTIVVGAQGPVLSQGEAPAWLATAGAGDVLTGVLGALLGARSREVLERPGLAAELAAVAASVHGRAAHAANPGGPVAALDVASAVPRVVADLLLTAPDAPA